MSQSGDGELHLLDDVGYLLARSSGITVRRTNEALADLGLRVRQYSVLSAACDTGGISQRALSDFLGLDPSQIVALADDLQERGLVERVPDERDRRTRLITPTEAGRQLYAQARAAAEGSSELSLASLTEDERTVLRDLLRRVVTAAVTPVAAAS
ncbi:MarR family winged helix-turn-helix transcriptional regulator [Phytoactinopolyspora halotolerans]|uniref:MarR family transcriptional regulator n=1 Tax=Phytoactinopolyspora halotolerans TaxID=1981512 RepID=A0A6L9S4X6_9ACTN|nr:MarR family transcriptional regulator [Phytoactinopolyspora halotolerans]NED99089.1 MarR family transcriptional regulator [Phytoactinopolyspora halotolerans]